MIPEEFLDLLKRDTRAFANLAVVLSDGTPQVSPIWFHYDGTHFIFNTARNRVKDKALHRHPMVAFSILDPKNPYRYLLVRGQVVEETEEGAYDGPLGSGSICDLNEKYKGDRNFPKRPTIRVIYKVLPLKVFAEND